MNSGPWGIPPSVRKSQRFRWARRHLTRRPEDVTELDLALPDAWPAAEVPKRVHIDG